MYSKCPLHFWHIPFPHFLSIKHKLRRVQLHHIASDRSRKHLEKFDGHLWPPRQALPAKPRQPRASNSSLQEIVGSRASLIQDKRKRPISVEARALSSVVGPHNSMVTSSRSDCGSSNRRRAWNKSWPVRTPFSSAEFVIIHDRLVSANKAPKGSTRGSWLRVRRPGTLGLTARMDPKT